MRWVWWFNEIIFIIRKVIKKPRGRPLLIWAKNQWRLKLTAKIVTFHTALSMENCLFTYSLSHLPYLCHFMHLWKITTFSTFFSFSGGRSCPSPSIRWWRPCINFINFIFLYFNEIKYALWTCLPWFLINNQCFKIN